MLYTQSLVRVYKNTKNAQTLYHTSVEACKCVLQIYKFYKNTLLLSTKTAHIYQKRAIKFH